MIGRPSLHCSCEMSYLSRGLLATYWRGIRKAVSPPCPYGIIFHVKGHHLFLPLYILHYYMLQDTAVLAERYDDIHNCPLGMQLWYCYPSAALLVWNCDIMPSSSGVILGIMSWITLRDPKKSFGTFPQNFLDTHSDDSLLNSIWRHYRDFLMDLDKIMLKFFELANQEHLNHIV